MFIVNRLHRVFVAPEERNVAEANPRLQHFAPWSSCLWVTVRIYKHSAPPELKRFVTTKSRALPLWPITSRSLDALPMDWAWDWVSVAALFEVAALQS